MRFFQLCLIATMTILFGCSSGQMANNDLVKRAESAAPSDISSTATILAADGAVLREGTSDWVCYPGIPLMPGDLHPMCVDSVWQDFLKAASEGKPFVTSSMGISYMLQGDHM